MTWKLSLLSLCFALECAACQSHLSRPQAEGEEVASQLNARYYDTRMSCDDNKPAYYCNGVIVRATGAGTDHDAWDPTESQLQLGGVSFSYLRADVGSRRLYGEKEGRPHGYIFKAADAYDEPDTFPAVILCSFPYDAVTTGRTERGCGAYSSYPESSRPCAELGIDTVEAWRKHFGEVTDIVWQHYHQCGFGADQQGFALSILARDRSLVVNEFFVHTEQMIGTWTSQDAARLPIAAIFYTEGEDVDIGRKGARYIQCRYLAVTGKVIPIVRFVTDGNLEPYSYRGDDQAAPSDCASVFASAGTH
jgi:hypothetical protein